MSKQTTQKNLKSQNRHHKRHRWRICGDYEYLVNSCTRHYQPSDKHPSGYDCPINAECRTNPLQKEYADELRFNEIIAMTKAHFSDLVDDSLKSGIPEFLNKYKPGDNFDKEIIGWVKYWSDILEPQESLDLNYKGVEVHDKLEDYKKEGSDPKHRPLMAIFCEIYKKLTGRDPWHI